jgi:broad specificity phosphatase PhoE/GNAT superfamily N-acetyltransferase
VSDLQCAATILVVRHGESEGNVGHRLSAAMPGEPLTERGRGQAAALAERLRGRRISYVYASPLLRAQQTGRVLAEAFGVGLGTLTDVREFSMGRCEGSLAEEDWAHIDQTFLRWFDGELTAGVDDGETGHEVVDRMHGALAEVADQHRGETVIVVSHGGIMSCALPRCATDVPDDYGRNRFVPNCGLVELDVDADGWALRQWPGDPDRAPHPGDLVDLVGRAEAAAERASGAAADVHGVPCTHFAIDAPWATRASLTEHADLPSADALDDVLAWLEATRPGVWLVRARAEQADSLPTSLVPAQRLSVWITDQRPRVTVPEGCEIDPARSAEEFLEVYGRNQAPLLDGRFGRDDHAFLVLRVDDAAVGCARVTQAGGTAYVSGIAVRPEHRGRGFGQLMSAAAVDHAVRASGIAWLHCEQRLDPFYEQLGLRRLTTHLDFGPAPS